MEENPFEKIKIFRVKPGRGYFWLRPRPQVPVVPLLLLLLIRSVWRKPIMRRLAAVAAARRLTATGTGSATSDHRWPIAVARRGLGVKNR